MLRFLRRGPSFPEHLYSMLKVRTAMASLLEVGSECGRFNRTGRTAVVTACHQVASIPAGPCAPLSLKKEPAKAVVIRYATFLSATGPADQETSTIAHGQRHRRRRMLGRPPGRGRAILAGSPSRRGSSERQDTQQRTYVACMS